jgi:hypothetical protein
MVTPFEIERESPLNRSSKISAQSAVDSLLRLLHGEKHFAVLFPEETPKFSHQSKRNQNVSLEKLRGAGTIRIRFDRLLIGHLR